MTTVDPSSFSSSALLLSIVSHVVQERDVSTWRVSASFTITRSWSWSRWGQSHQLTWPWCLRRSRRMECSCMMDSQNTWPLNCSTAESVSAMTLATILYPPCTGMYFLCHKTLFCVRRSGDRVSWYILIIKPTRCTSQIYFWNRTVRVLDRFSVHHQESSTVYTAIGICHTGYADCLLVGSGSILILLEGSILIPLANSQQTYMTYTIAVCTVLDSWWWTEILSETCRVLFQK